MVQAFGQKVDNFSFYAVTDAWPPSTNDFVNEPFDGHFSFQQQSSAYKRLFGLFMKRTCANNYTTDKDNAGTITLGGWDAKNCDLPVGSTPWLTLK